jgi:hypothetical protein
MVLCSWAAQFPSPLGLAHARSCPRLRSPRAADRPTPPESDTAARYCAGPHVRCLSPPPLRRPAVRVSATSAPPARRHPEVPLVLSGESCHRLTAVGPTTVPPPCCPERGDRAACWLGFPYRVYINSNRRDSWI